ncbi:MAG TPA: hypothetical protein VJO34_01400 [Methylomirabilota bacterium]|nr:hypothetical protein [Methylomirabilota bacterium]
MSKPPKIIKLGYHDIEFSVSSELPDGTTGHYSQNHRMLVVSKDQSPQDQVNTLFHEVVHVAWDLAKLEGSDEHEERVASVLGNLLTEFVSRNPGLLRWMQERLNESD